MARQTDNKKDAQAQRAAALRQRINELAAGETDLATPSPRELTDKAARQQWLKENPGLRKPRLAKRPPNTPQ